MMNSVALVFIFKSRIEQVMAIGFRQIKYGPTTEASFHKYVDRQMD